MDVKQNEDGSWELYLSEEDGQALFRWSRVFGKMGPVTAYGQNKGDRDIATELVRQMIVEAGYRKEVQA